MALDVDAVRSCVDNVAFAAAKDESRPALAGILLNTKGSVLQFVAADGFRLATSTLPLAESAMAEVRCLVPARTLTVWNRLTAGQTGEMVLSVAPARVQLEIDEITLVSRVIDGALPEWEKVVPQSPWQNRAIATKKDLERAIKLAVPFARQSQNVVRLDMTPDADGPGGKLVIAANTKEVGDARARASLTGVQQGEASVIAVNIGFLQQTVAAIKTYQSEFHTRGPDAPLIVYPLGDDTYLQIIMPMSLR